MRRIKLIRPHEGKVVFPAVQDIAWQLAQPKAKDTLVLGLSGGPAMRRILKSLIEAIEERDVSIFPRLQVFEVNDEAATGERSRTNWDDIMDDFADIAMVRGYMTLDQFHRMPFTDNAPADLEHYNAVFAGKGGKFDVAVLSISGGRFEPHGPENPGSLAGLFPGYPDIWKAQQAFIATRGPMHPPRRGMTVSPYALGQTPYLLAILQGEENRNAHQRLFDSEHRPAEVPSHLLYTQGDGETMIYTDLSS